ncbi:MAG: hypothetical protein K2H19_07050, partial [Ruminococcus sp.]|nr:hypothetical protein [Ruminococcus sp.]
MTKIKSLIYRELVIAKKFYITFFLVIIFFMVMGWLIALSAKIGNIAEMMTEVPEFSSMFDIIIYYIFNYFTAFVCGAIINDNGVILSDIKSNWRTFSFTLPATEKEKSMAKLIIKLCGTVSALLICVFNGLVLSGITGAEFELKNISIY